MVNPYTPEFTWEPRGGRSKSARVVVSRDRGAIIANAAITPGHEYGSNYDRYLVSYKITIEGPVLDNGQYDLTVVDNAQGNFPSWLEACAWAESHIRRGLVAAELML